MELPKMRVTNKEAFEKAALDAHRVAKGIGYKGVAEIMVEVGIEHHVAGKRITGNKRRRVKKLTKLVKQAYIQSVFEHTEVIK